MNKTIEVQALENAYREYEKNVDGIPQLAEYQRGIKEGILHAIGVIQNNQQPLTASSGKERELQFLTQIAEACGEGSYLHSLFSNDLVAWAERTILEGEKPDVYKYWLLNIEEWKKEASRTLELSVQVAESQNEIICLEQLMQQYKDRYIAALDECNKKWVKTVSENAKVYERRLREKEEELNLRNNQVQQAALELQPLRQTSSRQYTEILLLKAEIYDLTHRRED